MDETPRDLVDFFTDSCDTLQLGEFIKEGLDVNEPLSLEDGHRPLHVAAASGNKDMVEALLARGVEVDMRNYRGNTALHYAAREGHVTVVCMLLNREADPNSNNDEGCSILQNAVCFEHLEVIRVLLSKGADFRAVISAEYLPPRLQVDQCGFIEHESLLSLAFELENLPIIQKLILAGANVVDESSKLMKIAIRKMNFDLVMVLLEKGAEIIGHFIEISPLEKAVSSGWYSLVEMILDMQVNMRMMPTLLMSALSSGHLDIAKLLIERGAELSVELKNTALKCVVDKGHTDVAEWLFNHGPEVVTSHSELINYLVKAITNGNITLAHLIIDKIDDVNVTIGDSNHRETAIIAATKRGLVPVIDLLLKKGAKATSPDSFGRTALYYAIETEMWIDVFNVFVKWGVSLNELIDTNSKYRALHKAVKDGKLDLVEYLLQNGADVNAEDRNGSTPFHMIFLSCGIDNRLHLIKQFMEKGADLYQANKCGQTPVNFAIRQKCWQSKKSSESLEMFFIKECFDGQHLESIESLIQDLLKKKHIDLVTLAFQKLMRYLYEERVLSRNTTNNISASKPFGKIRTHGNSGTNLLHCAAYKGDVKLLTTTLRNGLDVDDITKEGFTALQIALYMGNTELAQYLIKQGAKVNIEDGFDLLPFHVALMSGYDDTLVKQLYFKTCLKKYPTTVFGVPLLHLVAYNGSVSLVKFLLSKGLNINTTDEKNSTILHIAVKTENHELVNFLLENGIDKNAQEKPTGDTALHLALRQVLLFDMSLEIPQSLLRHKVDINLPNSSNETAVHYAACTPLANLLLTKGVRNINMRNVDGRSPLHLLADYLQDREKLSFEPTTQIVLFLEHKADVAMRDPHEQTILAILLENKLVDIKRVEKCWKGNFASVMSYDEITNLFKTISLISDKQLRRKRQLDLMDVLIRQGFKLVEKTYWMDPHDTRFYHDETSFGDSLVGHIMKDENTDLFKFFLEKETRLSLKGLLNLATTNKKLYHTKLLLDKIDVNSDTTDVHVMFPEYTRHYSRFMRYGLMQMYLDRIKVKDSTRNCPLLAHMAYHGFFLITKILLDKGVNINSVDDEANTALHYAAALSNTQIFYLLLSKGAQIEPVNSKKETPIHFAATGGNLDVFKSLLARGARTLTKDLDGNTLLHKTRSCEIARILVKRGVYVNARNSVRRTALHCLVDIPLHDSTEAPDTAALLIQAGAKVDERDSDGMTALHLAAMNNYTLTATVLLSNGADVYLRDQQRRTALILAIKGFGDATMVKCLLDEGALPYLKDEEGFPLLTMEIYRHQFIEEIFKKHSLKERLVGLPNEDFLEEYLNAEDESSCLEELERLESTYLSETFSLFEIFSSFKNPTHLFNEELLRAIDMFFSSGKLKQFPNYRGILKSAIRRSKRTRCYLKHQALETISELHIPKDFFRNLPTVVWTHLLTFLSIKDLDNIVACGTGNGHVYDDEE